MHRKMAIRKRRESSPQSVIVVLDGIKASTEKAGVAPLRKAMQNVAGPEDEILVLTLLREKASMPPSNAGFCCVDGRDHSYNQFCQRDPYFKFLHHGISRRKEAYKQIFRPFYKKCKSYGVKFQVKIAAGFQPKDILILEANNCKATWIVMDRCFAKDMSFRLPGTDCNVSLVSDEEEAIYDHKNLRLDHKPETSVAKKETNQEFQELIKEKKSLEESICEPESQHFPPYLPANKSRGSRECEKNENLVNVKSPANNLRNFPGDNVVLGLPVQLTWEVIVRMTSDFEERIYTDQNKNFTTYLGYMSDHKSYVMVKRFKGGYDHILKEEKKAALSTNHKNILRLIAYHKSENATVLVFPFAKRESLDKYICGSMGYLSFEQKMKIAQGIAQGVQYMHEECPRGPIVHGELLPSNVFLRHDFRPMISGFGGAKWLQLDQSSPVSHNRWWSKKPSDNEPMALVLKSDILSFGVLLLRLFCRKHETWDDKYLIQWARPLLLQRAFHEMVDEESEDLDMHQIYRVMSAATQCTRTKPVSRPCISEVISILKGESFCTMQSSPSSDSPLMTK